MGLFGIFLLYRYGETKLLLEKKGDRHVWDLGLTPGISKLFWTGEWPIVFATGLLIFVAILAITTNSDLWDMFKVNLGVVFGICVRWAESKIKKECNHGIVWCPDCVGGCTSTGNPVGLFNSSRNDPGFRAGLEPAWALTAHLRLQDKEKAPKIGKQAGGEVLGRQLPHNSEYQLYCVKGNIHEVSTSGKQEPSH
jgi:hypothetical protein